MNTAPRRRLPAIDEPAATILIRLLVGVVFLSEGLQKFLFPSELGAGRFAKIGLPSPDILASFVGTIEIGCGLFLLLGLLTRPAALLLLVDIMVAIGTTKVPMLFKDGFWKMAHEARTDWCMLLGLLFLLLVGAGRVSLDHRLSPTIPDRTTP